MTIANELSPRRASVTRDRVQRRRHERHTVAVPVTFTCEGTIVSAHSKDLSLGGMFIETDRALPYGTRFSLEVTLPAVREPLRFDATVRWTSPQGMGVQWGALRIIETWALNQVLRGGHQPSTR
jgi:type IV pilus assembly protein PilZ